MAMAIAEELSKNGVFRKPASSCGDNDLEVIIKGTDMQYVKVSDYPPEDARYNPHLVEVNAFPNRNGFVWTNDVLCSQGFYSVISKVDKDKLKDAILSQVNEELKAEFASKEDYCREYLEVQRDRYQFAIEINFKNPLDLVIYYTGNEMVGKGVCTERSIAKYSYICIYAGVIFKDLRLLEKSKMHRALYVEEIIHPIFSDDLEKLKTTKGYLEGEYLGNFGHFLLHAPPPDDLNDLFSISEKIQGQVAVANAVFNNHSYENWPVLMLSAGSEIKAREGLFIGYDPGYLCRMEYWYGIETRLLNKRGGVTSTDDYRCRYINLRKVSSKSNNFIYFPIKLKDAMELVLENKSFKICAEGEEFNLTKESLLEILNEKLQLIKNKGWEKQLDVRAIEMLQEAIKLKQRLEDTNITFQERCVIKLKLMWLHLESGRNLDEEPCLRKLQEACNSCPYFKDFERHEFREDEFNDLFSKIRTTLSDDIPKDALENVRKEFKEITAEYTSSKNQHISNSTHTP